MTFCGRFASLAGILLLAFSPARVLAQEAPLPVYTLEDCLNLALQKNPDLLAAQTQIEAATGSSIEAKAGFLPNLGINANYQYREYGFSHDPNRLPEEWNLSIRLTQNLYSGGSVRARVAISKLIEDTRLQEYRATADRVIAEVRTAFYDVLQARENASLRLESIQFYEKEVQRQQQRLEAGTGNQRDLLRAKVSLANERPTLVDSDTLAKNALLRLCQLLGLSYSIPNDHVPFDIKGSLPLTPLQTPLAQLLQTAQSRRPELKARLNDLETARQQVKVERAPVLPRLDGFIAYEALNNTDKSAKSDIDHGYVVGLNGTWQLFDGFASEGRVKTAEARVGQAQTGRDGLILSIQSEVLTSYYRLSQARSTLESQTHAVSLAREALELAESSFEAGRGSQLDILNSRLELTRARLTELNARHDYPVALAQLQRAVSSELQLVDGPTPKIPIEPVPTPVPTPVYTPAQTPPAAISNPQLSPPESGDTRLRINPSQP